jgi:hypothetical protein
MPKTKLWHRMNQEGRMLKDSVGNNTSDDLNFSPTMGADNLRKGYKQLIANLYSQRSYAKRIRNFIRDYKPTARERFSFAKMEAFLRSVFKIGIFSRSCVLYWRSLVTALVRNPKTFSGVVELMIHWPHYRKRAKEISD